MDEQFARLVGGEVLCWILVNNGLCGIHKAVNQRSLDERREPGVTREQQIVA